MKKYSKKLIMSFLASTFGAVTSLFVLFPLLNSTNTSQITNISNTNQATESTSFIPSETNEQNANISTTNGPVTFLGNTITALDWYGNKMWDLDLAKEVSDVNGTKPGNNYSDGAWKCAWFNWDYNRSTNTIWALGFWSKKTKK